MNTAMSNVTISNSNKMLSCLVLEIAISLNNRKYGCYQPLIDIESN